MRRFIGVDVGVNTNIYDWLQVVTIGCDWLRLVQLVTIGDDPEVMVMDRCTHGCIDGQRSHNNLR